MKDTKGKEPLNCYSVAIMNLFSVSHVLKHVAAVSEIDQHFTILNFQVCFKNQAIVQI